MRTFLWMLILAFNCSPIFAAAVGTGVPQQWAQAHDNEEQGVVEDFFAAIEQSGSSCRCQTGDGFSVCSITCPVGKAALCEKVTTGVLPRCVCQCI